MFPIVIAWSKAQDAVNFLNALEDRTSAQDALRHAIEVQMNQARQDALNLVNTDQDSIKVNLSNPQIVCLARILAR